MLEWLFLNSNQLSGPIPPELGNLSALSRLNLSSNKLAGPIPQEMENIVNLNNNDSDFRWNSLHTNNESLKNFLNSAQIGGDWESTQTIAPERVVARTISNTAIEISWQPITYTSGEGGYRVFYSLTPGGPYTLFNSTAAKYDFSLEITGLKTFTRYYFVVQTRTEPHEYNQNTVDSEYSAEISEMTQEPYKTISGRVATVDGKGITEVTLFFSPPNQFNQFTVTDENGNYSHVVDLYWTGTVIPSKTGYTFEPAIKTFENLTSDQPGTNFIGNLIPLSLSGKVTSLDEGIKGIILTFIANNGETELDITDSNGAYSHGVPYGWTGKTIPSKDDLLFYPSFIDYLPPGVIGNRDHQDFQLSVSLALKTIRKQDSSLIIKKEYGEIELNVGLKENAITAVQKLIVYRKESGGPLQPNKEFVVQEQKNNYQFTYRDEYLEKDKTFTYIAKAFDTQGKIIGESKEKTI